MDYDGELTMMMTGLNMISVAVDGYSWNKIICEWTTHSPYCALSIIVIGDCDCPMICCPIQWPVATLLSNCRLINGSFRKVLSMGRVS